MNAAEIRDKIAALETEKRVLKVKVDGQKLNLNGNFGKFGSSYSSLYAPHLLVAVTLTGQLSILQMIERAETAGISVVSANTDGLTLRCPRIKLDELNEMIRTWEEETGFETEYTPYQALYNASVNSYIAVKEKGTPKVKGPIADPWAEGDSRGMMSKNPQATVVSEAAVRWLTDRVPVERTIRGEPDPRRFLTLVRVAEGGVWRGLKLGKACRWYWSTDGDPILTAATGRRVGKTEGARPMMEILGRVPDDVDYLRYCEEAERLLSDLGARREGLVR